MKIVKEFFLTIGTRKYIIQTDFKISIKTKLNVKIILNSWSTVNITLKKHLPDIFK